MLAILGIPSEMVFVCASGINKKLMKAILCLWVGCLMVTPMQAMDGLPLPDNLELKDGFTDRDIVEMTALIQQDGELLELADLINQIDLDDSKEYVSLKNQNHPVQNCSKPTSNSKQSTSPERSKIPIHAHETRCDSRSSQTVKPGRAKISLSPDPLSRGGRSDTRGSSLGSPLSQSRGERVSPSPTPKNLSSSGGNDQSEVNKSKRSKNSLNPLKLFRSSDSEDSSSSLPSPSSQESPKYPSNVTTRRKKSTDHSDHSFLSRIGFKKNSPKKNELIEAVISQDYDEVGRYLACPLTDVNAKDEYGNTALHRAVLQKNVKIFWMLFFHMGINSLFYNDDKRLAQSLCDKENCKVGQDFYKALFARGAVERTIDNLMIKYHKKIENLDDNLIDTLLKKTWKILNKDSKHLLMDFVTDDFIKRMIKARAADHRSAIIFVRKSLEIITVKLLNDGTIFTIGYVFEEVRDMFIQTCIDRVPPYVPNDFIEYAINPLIFPLMQKDPTYLEKSVRQCAKRVVSNLNLTDKAFNDFSKFEKWLLDFTIYYLCHHGVEEPLFSQISPQYINNILSEIVGLIFQFKSDAFEDGSTTEEFLEDFQARARMLNHRDDC